MRKHLLSALMVSPFLMQQVAAQSRTITGRITDQATGQGLPGVTVLAKGTTVGTSTNADGTYSLNVPISATALTFSSIGYTSTERAIGDNTSINVALATDSKQIGEVVVTALGLEANRDQLGTAQSRVQGQSLVQSGETSVITGLSGKTPGVLITRSSGDPGASANIQIRGASTITGNLQPLIVVDGVPIFNSSIGNDGILTSNGGAGSNQTDGVVQASRLNDINPDDIASVEILKGAPAAALWGTRAANGVMVITTKKGRAGDKLNISYRTSYGLDRINKSVPLQNTFGQGLNGLYNQGASTSWGDRIADRSGGTDAFITNPASPGYRGFVTFSDGTTRYAIAPGTPANPHGGKNSRETFDHSREVFDTGYTWENQASISGGDAKSLFYVSLGNTHTKGIAVRNSDNDRTTFRVNAERQLADKFRAAVNVTYARTLSNRIQQGSNLSGIFLGGLRTPADYDNSRYVGTYTNAAGVSFPGRQVTYRSQLGANQGTDPATLNVYANPGYDNPFWTIDNVLNQTRVNRLVGGLELTYDFADWLHLLNRTGVDTYTDRRSANFPLGSGANLTGLITEESIQETQVNNDLILRGNYDFSENLGLTALAGFNFNARRSSQVGGTTRSVINSLAPPQLDNTPAASRDPFNLLVEQRNAAAYAQVDLNLFRQVFLTGTARGESASTFGPEAQSTFFYPAGSLAWQFTELGALKDNKILSFGKARLAYGSVGVQPAPYLTRTYFVPANSSVIIDGWGSGLNSANYFGASIRSGTLGNTLLRPERKNELEGGFDLRFWQDRISLGATAYTNKTTDAILQVPVAASTGFTLVSANAAEIENRGIELDLNADIIKTDDFGFSLSPNFSKNRNEVTSLAGATSIALNGFSGSQSRAVQGYQLGALWGTRWDRNENGALALDANGFPVQAATEGVIGDPNPKWRGGLGATVRYKGLSLYALVDHVNDVDVWNGTKGALYFFGTHADVGQETTLSAEDARSIKLWDGSTVFETYGNPADPNADVRFRGSIRDFGVGRVALDQNWYRSGPGSGFTGPTEQFVENVNYTRLREITLSYNLATEWFRNATKLQSVDFRITGRNLVLWTDYTGVDPETNLTGVSNGRGLDYFNNPSVRSLIFTLQINY